MRVDHLAFYSSLFLSRLADQILLFMVPLVVFQVTQSAAWSGIAFFAETLPRFTVFFRSAARCVTGFHLFACCASVRCFVR